MRMVVEMDRVNVDKGKIKLRGAYVRGEEVRDQSKWGLEKETRYIGK